MTKVWVYAEISAGQVHRVSLELLTKARQLGDEVTAVALGKGAAAQAKLLGEHGAHRVLVHEDEAYSQFLSEPAADTLAMLIEKEKPDLLLIGTTYDGRDIASRLNARLDCGVITDANEISMENGQLKTQVPWFSASTVVDVTSTGQLKLILVRPKAFQAEQIQNAPAPKVEQISASFSDNAKRARVVEDIVQKSEGPTLEEAAIVISGGRGLKQAENFKLLNTLAGQIGGAVGATRAVVDAGWVPYSYQVGQTGKTVKPSIYIACGISGAIQHTVGMKGAKYIIAINTDADAPIFKFADLGVVGDVLKILPALSEEIKRRKG